MGLLEYIFSAVLDTIKIIAVGLLPAIIFAFIMQKISNSIRIRLASFLGIKGYIYLTFLGVVIHELSHAFFCVVFRHKIVKMKLFSPENDGTLGYVQHTYKSDSLFQKSGNFFIGIAPIFGGFFALFLISKFLLPHEMLALDTIGSYLAVFLEYIFSLSFWVRWQTWIWLYLILSIASHITLSKPDLDGASAGVLSLIIFILFLNLIVSWIFDLATIILNMSYNFWQYSVVLLGGTTILLLLLSIILTIIIRK